MDAPSAIIGILLGLFLALIITVAVDGDRNDDENELRKASCHSPSGEVLFDGYVWGSISQTDYQRWKFRDPLTDRTIFVTGYCSAVPVELEDLKDVDPEFSRKLYERHATSEE